MSFPKGYFHHSEESKRMIGEALKGIPLSEEHRKNIGIANKGKKRSEKTKQRIGKASKKRLKDPKERQKFTFKGRRHSTEARQKISNSLKGIVVSLKTKRKLRKAHLGIKDGPLPPEQKEKIRKSNTGRKKNQSYFYKLLKSILLEVGFVIEKRVGRYRADFIHLASKTIIEHDTKGHDQLGYQKIDRKRDKYLKARGYRVIHVKEYPWSNKK